MPFILLTNWILDKKSHIRLNTNFHILEKKSSHMFKKKTVFLKIFKFKIYNNVQIIHVYTAYLKIAHWQNKRYDTPSCDNSANVIAHDGIRVSYRVRLKAATKTSKMRLTTYRETLEHFTHSNRLTRSLYSMNWAQNWHALYVH